SFQADTASSAVPRTPWPQSSAMTTLCSASPTTSTKKATTPKRTLALIDDRHQRQAEVHDADAAGEERCEGASREEVDVVPGLLPESPVDLARRPLGKPVDERKSRVHLHREEPVRRGEEETPADAQRLRDELPLAVTTSDVLDHGVREDHVELAVGERQRA